MIDRELDFVVIGVQKGGTTTLWRHLTLHPSITMAVRKEVPFFCEEESTRPGALADYMELHFSDAPDDSLLGTATPQYMMGKGEFDVERIADQIAAMRPDIRLIAMLRDPIERAGSQHRMAVRRGWEERSFEAAMGDQLDPAALSEGRHRPDETNSYVAQGEYGRILGVYRERFPTGQIHVDMLENLEHEPAEVLDRLLTFLGLPAGYRPDRLNARLHRGGNEKLLDRESEALLFEFMRERVLPNLGEKSDYVRRAFNAFMMIWNIAPENRPPPLSEPLRARLQAHYEADAEALAELGYAAPWIESWREASGS